jgi:co-chaperonin GroES (HSP10)
MSVPLMENARPLGNRILCRRVLTEETLPGGKVILLAERREQSAAQQAEVVLAGQGRFDEDGAYAPVDARLTPGTWILHRQFARSHTSEDGEYFLLKEEDIVAILEAI